MSIEKTVLEKLLKLPVEKQKEVLDFLDSMWRRHRAAKKLPAELSEAEHRHMLQILDDVAALSETDGPAVSNRDHDIYLYGRH